MPGPYTEVDVSMTIIPATANNPFIIWRIIRIRLLMSTEFLEMCFFFFLPVIIKFLFSIAE